MARICDICDREIGTYNSRYTLTYKSVLYSKEKDICPLCFEKLQEQFKEHKVKTEPQTCENRECKNYDTINDHCRFIEQCNYEPHTSDLSKLLKESDEQAKCAWR